MTDKELLRRCQADPNAFGELVRRYRRAIYAYSLAATGSRQDAEEIVQDVFVKVYRWAHRFNDQYSFTTWLYTIASNTCKNKYRSRGRDLLSLNDEETVIPVSREATPLDVYERNVELSEVRNAINELPVRYRQVLYLRYVEGMSYKDIAAVLGLSLGNVEARIFRGKERIRQKLLRTSGSDGYRASDGAKGDLT